MDIKEILNKLPPAPAGIEKWIQKEVIKKTYIIYSKTENKAVCTRCGHTFRTDRFDMKHGAKGECPRCKFEATYKASGKGRKNCAEYFRIFIFTHRGRSVYGTLWEIEADFTEFGTPQLGKWLSAVYLFNETKQVYYKHYPEWAWEPERWERKKKINLPRPPSALFGRTKFHSTVLYEQNLESVFTKSCLKYSWDEEFLKKAEFNAYGYIEYISLSLRYHSLELLRKAGFENLVIDKVDGRYFGHSVNWRGKTLSRILCIPKRHIRKLQQMNPNYRELILFKSLTEREKQMPSAFIRRMSENEYYLEDIKEHTTLIKWYEYTLIQDVRAYDWIDYIKACRKLGMDINRKKILFPEKFQEAHDEATQKVKIENIRKLDEQIRKVTFNLEIEGDGFRLFMARTQTELNEESAALNHCVRAYGEKIAQGRCYIFFIRKMAEPESPYYTMETRLDGTLIQCRGDHNRSMTNEVSAFVGNAIEELKKILKNNSERSAA